MSFDRRASTGLMLGRFQPWHKGHRALFEKILEKHGQVCIAIRDTEGLDGNKNPLSATDVARRIMNDLDDAFRGRFMIVIMPNITDICYGREVGYTISQIELPAEIQAISATAIRKEQGL